MTYIRYFNKSTHNVEPQFAEELTEQEFEEMIFLDKL